MKCNNVSTTNLDIIYGYVNNKNERNVPPSQLSRILNRVVIRFDMSELTAFSIISLKSISRVELIKNGGHFSLPHNKSHIEELYRNLVDLSTEDEMMFNKLYGLSDSVRNHAHVENELVPVDVIGAVRYDCVAIFTGSDILNLFGYQLEKMFHIPEGSENEPFESVIENNLVAAIFNAISKGVYNMLTSKDVITDAWLNQHVYSKTSQPYTLARIFDCNGNSVEFIDNSEESIKSTLSKAMPKISDDSDNPQPFNQWNIEIVCDTPIYMYFYFMLFCNDKVTISDHSDYMLLLTDICKCEFSGIGETDTAWNPNSRVIYDNWFNKKIKETSLGLIDRFYLCPRWRHIKYTMIIPIKSYYSKDAIIENICKDLFKSSEVYPREMGLIHILHQVSVLLYHYKLISTSK